MSGDYRQIFEQRGRMYNEATALVPAAREAERQELIGRLDLAAGQRVLDVPAGGGYLADGIRELWGEAVPLVCVEPSEVFAADLSPDYQQVHCTMTDLALPGAHVDRAGSLAGIHHLTHDEKLQAFREVRRVLRPGGLFALADVLEGSAVGRFLNGPVDEYCLTGHHGMFLPMGWTSGALAEAGFEQAEETVEHYDWVFPSYDHMVRYCWNLFGLTEATLEEVADALEAELRVSVLPDEVRLGWSLVYATGTVPD